MPKASKFSPDEGITIYDLKDSEAVHYGDQSKGYVGKNQITIPYNGTLTDISSTLTITVDSQNRIVLNGTQSESTGQYYLHNRNAYDFQLPAGSYVLTGGDSQTPIGLNKNKVTGDASQGGDFLGSDTGNGVAFTLTDISDIQVILFISTGTYNNKVISPMIRLSSVLDSTYEPRLIPNNELSNSINNYDYVLGSKNLLPFPYYDTTKTVGTGSFTVNSDGTITVNGSFPSAANFELWANANLNLNQKVILTGCPKGGHVSQTYSIQVYTQNESSGEINDTGDGALINNVNNLITRIVIRIRAGQSFNNMVFKPMLRLASDPNNTYAPYAKTNRELTKIAVDNNVIDLPAGASVTLLEKTKLILTVIPLTGNASIIACQMGTENPWVIAGTTPIASNIAVDNSVNSKVTITNNFTYAISVFVQGRYEVQ